MVSGELLIEWRDIGTDRERLVVTRADPHVLASPELVQHWRTDQPRHITREGDVIRLGTQGEGLGVVAYRIGEPQSGVHHMIEYPSVPLTRVE